ncbi:hypothetical protein [Leptospira perdikensis]|uniref:Uncharacterized protein n=1 Tax=Leptospira perdikensis TaxID=2484948 RepID=A0A4R9JJY0_9LEPT|nr:hypothetical protein [Leptospira perdikensis]TGL45639.1 hypothetical protein EHQ49_01165 [Leptospira perdikensis]
MKTFKPIQKHLERIRNRGIQFVRWNLLVLLITGLSLFFLKCEGKSSGKETHLVPILLASDPNTTSQLGNNQGGSAGTELPIAVEDTSAGVPILNEITYITNDANPADDPYSTKGLLQFQKSSVSFQKPVPANTEVSLYFGKKNMELQPDGTVTNALQSLKRTAANFSGYTYLTDADKKIKVFVVAKNQFGVSTKQLTIGHPRNCANALKIPATVGDCNDHCFDITKIGDTVEITAKYNLPIDGTSLYLDLVGSSPRSLPDNIAKAVNLEIPSPKVGLHTVKTSFNIYEKEYLCTKVISFLTIDQPLRFAIAQGYISIPND